MNNVRDTHLHPLEKAGALDSKFRRMLQNPEKILKNYISEGMTVLDLGCGTGYFTLEIAKLLGNNGKVIALDVQPGMLEILKQKINNSSLQRRIQIHLGTENSLQLTEEVDFVIAFYSFHEMKCIDDIITGLVKIVKPETKILISEQKFHVSGRTFYTIIQKLLNQGFEILEQPRIFFSRTVVMQLKTPPHDG